MGYRCCGDIRGPRRRVEEGTATAVAGCCAPCVTGRGERFLHIVAVYEALGSSQICAADLLAPVWSCAAPLPFLSSDGYLVLDLAYLACDVTPHRHVRDVGVEGVSDSLGSQPGNW